MSIFNGLIDFIARILAFFYELPVVGNSYGIAIMLLTFAVMVLLMPLTLRATRSMIKMQELQPEMKRIQEQYKGGDREAMNAEMMKFYSENGINPVGGCLPMVAQTPVFIVLFQVLRGLTRRFEDLPFFTVAEKLRVARGLDPIDGTTFDPQFLERDSALYEDLAGSSTMKFGPLDLSARAVDVVQSSPFEAIPYLLLVAFIIGASYYQQKQVMARRKPDSTANQSPMMQQQQMLMRFLPLVTGISSFFFPAGLPLYWGTSSVFRIGQQAYITHQIYGKEAEKRASAKPNDADEPSSKPATKDIPKSTAENEPPSSKAKAKPTKQSSNGRTAEPDGRASDKRQAWSSKRKANQQKVNRSSGSSKRPSRVTEKGTKSQERAPKRKKKR